MSQKTVHILMHCLISLYVKSCYVVGTLQTAGFALFHCM